MRNALLVHRSLSEGNDAGPADREAVRWNAQGLQTSVVLLVQVVLVGGNIGSAVVRDGIDPTVGNEIPLGLPSVMDHTRNSKGRVLTTEGPLPSASTAPSTWRAAEATPHKKSSGNLALSTSET